MKLKNFFQNLTTQDNKKDLFFNLKEDKIFSNPDQFNKYYEQLKSKELCGDLKTYDKYNQFKIEKYDLTNIHYIDLIKDKEKYISLTSLKKYEAALKVAKEKYTEEIRAKITEKTQSKVTQK
jgi:hypothetical protein